jgi:hypothetical protein
MIDKRALRPLKLTDALHELDSEELIATCRQWGIGCPPEGDDEVAARLFGGDVQYLWTVQDAALRKLGFLWLTHTLLPAHLALAEAA